MYARVGLGLLFALCWNATALAQVNEPHCAKASKARSEGRAEMAKWCAAGSNDALSFYAAARRFVRVNEDFLRFFDFWKCPKGEAAVLRSELWQARNITNVKSKDATRLFVEGMVIDALFVTSVRTLKMYVCLEMISEHARTQYEPQYQGNGLVEETLPIDVGKTEQQIRFKNRTHGSVCGLVRLPAAGPFREFEDSLYLETKKHIRPIAAELAGLFMREPPSQEKSEELRTKFVKIATEYQTKFARELESRAPKFDAAELLADLLLAKRENRVIVIEADDTPQEMAKHYYDKTSEKFVSFVRWVEDKLLKP